MVLGRLVAMLLLLLLRRSLQQPGLAGVVDAICCYLETVVAVDMDWNFAVTTEGEGSS